MQAKHQAKKHWDNFLAGNPAAFRALHDLTYDDLYRYAHRLRPDPAAARDALQEVYLAIWQRRDRVPPVRDPWVFLLVSLRNRIIDQVRKERTLNIKHEPSPSPEDDLLAAEQDDRRRAWLRDHLGQLPDSQREALHLRYHLELEYPQVAEVLGVSQQAAYNYVNRGIKALKKDVQEAPTWFFEK
ncbi:MAG: sigma-70 family RNA polymerase sigma factor [Bacteroidota bacterium]